MEKQMRKLLITGFEPFGDDEINPSWDAVARLPDIIKEYKLEKLLLPVTFGEAAKIVIQTAERISPDAILCIGQAGGRDAVTPELVGINLRYASIPDNSGYQPKDEPISAGAAAAYFSTLPMRKITSAISEAKISARLSYSAGSYVCNDLLYTLLSHFADSEIRVGFVHIPYSTEQNKQPCMDINEIIRALTIAVENLDE